MTAKQQLITCILYGLWYNKLMVNNTYHSAYICNFSSSQSNPVFLIVLLITGTPYAAKHKTTKAAQYSPLILRCVFYHAWILSASGANVWRVTLGNSKKSASSSLTLPRSKLFAQVWWTTSWYSCYWTVDYKKTWHFLDDILLQST